MAAKDEMSEKLTGEVLASLVTRGDLSALVPAQKAQYYSQLCHRVGLDPATQPFQMLKLQGKEVLYATKGAAEQLRNLHKISISIVARERLEDVYYVTARAVMADGRSDESQGAVTIANLKGDALANAIMKAETKAKRRVTLSIVGLGMLDESELDTIPQARFDNIPKEQPRQEEPLKVVAIEPKRAPEKKGEALPAVPNEVGIIPVSIRNAIKPLSQIGEVAMSDMDDEDLELCREHALKAKDVWKLTAKSQRALDWLDAIARTASELLAMRQNPDAPDEGP